MSDEQLVRHLVPNLRSILLELGQTRTSPIPVGASRPSWRRSRPIRQVTEAHLPGGR
nr:hypothetical protein [Nonomuraea basaltis]